MDDKSFLKEINEEDFHRNFHIIDHQNDTNESLLALTCVETAEHREAKTGRPISMRELELKASMESKEYVKLLKE